MVLEAMPGVMWLEQHLVGTTSVICWTICFTTSMCISLPSEHIALKNPVCFVLFMIDKERQKKKKPTKSLFQQQIWTMEKPTKTGKRIIISLIAVSPNGKMLVQKWRSVRHLLLGFIWRMKTSWSNGPYSQPVLEPLHWQLLLACSAEWWHNKKSIN